MLAWVSIYLYTYAYIYVYIPVCKKHTHTYIYIYTPLCAEGGCESTRLLRAEIEAAHGGSGRRAMQASNACFQGPHRPHRLCRMKYDMLDGVYA